MTERLRFAPSPTGFLHLGGARTALYNWLWVKQRGGSFILRVEDTDQERSTSESTQMVFDSLRWLGLHWDEGPEVGGPHGPYFQTQRLELYREFADRLIQTGHAYRCYATKDEIAAAREAHRASGSKQGFRFISPWRDVSPNTKAPDRPAAIRLRAPTSGTTGWNDLVYGRIDVPNETQQDVILLRPDGLPLYNFGCVVDDHTMGITLAVRGEDHIVNTPIQLLLYEALGAEPPSSAHLPLILGHDGHKLSKRHAAVGVLEYRDHGYLPDSVNNYLARLGWSHGDQEIFTRAELIQCFDWSHVGKTGAKYDPKKFAFVQAEHLRALNPQQLAKLAQVELQNRGIPLDPADPRLLRAVDEVKTRATTTHELADDVIFFFQPIRDYEPKGKKKFLTPDRAETLEAFARCVSEAPQPFTAEGLEQTTQAWLQDAGLTMKDFAQSARVALTGRTRSPGLFDVIEILGRDESLERLMAGVHVAKSPTS